MHKHRWQIWEEQFENEIEKFTHLKKNSQSVDWKAVASFQTANIRITPPANNKWWANCSLIIFSANHQALFFHLAKDLS